MGECKNYYWIYMGTYSYIFIYIYMCVCVYVCVYFKNYLKDINRIFNSIYVSIVENGSAMEVVIEENLSFMCDLFWLKIYLNSY